MLEKIRRYVEKWHMIENGDKIIVGVSGGADSICLLFVLIQLPKLLKLPFYPSYGALTFPFVISAVAMKKLLLFLTAEGIGYPSMLSTVVLIEEVIAVVMVTYALIRYLLYLGQIYQRGKSGCGA